MLDLFVKDLRAWLLWYEILPADEHAKDLDIYMDRQDMAHSSMLLECSAGRIVAV